MKALWDFLLELAMPYLLILAGIGLVALSFEVQSWWVFWPGIALAVGGGLWLVWNASSSGPFSD